MKLVFKTILVVILGASISCVTLTEKMFLIPSKTIDENYSISENYSVYPITIKSNEGLLINAVHLKTNDNPEALIILFRGNFGNIYTKDWIKVYNALSEMKVDLITFDYYGFGLSEGRASFDNILLSSTEALDYILDISDSDIPIFLYGLSLGTYPAIKLAQNSQIDGLLLEGAYSSSDDVLSHYQKKYWYSILRMDDNLGFESISEISVYDKPLLMIVDKKDKAIPYKMSELLFDSCKSVTKEIVYFEQSGHCEASFVESDKFRLALERFINEL